MVSSPSFMKTEYGTKKMPFTEPEWKIPGYTGYVAGLQETYAKTPVLSQAETKHPSRESVIYTRTQVPAKHTPERDPCNNKANFQKPVPDTLWPHLQEKALQDSAKPPRSNIMNGDLRTDVFITSYSTSFAAPFEAHKQIRSPMRNATLVNCPTLRQHYTSAYSRVGEKRLYKMVSTMSERLAAKLGNCNDNAFRMRKLFKMYDEKRTGYIELQDFRMMVESFGIQLDDDSLLALFSVYDPQGTGYMHYEDLMKALLDPDYFSLYVGNVDNTQERLDASNHEAMLLTIKGKF